MIRQKIVVFFILFFFSTLLFSEQKQEKLKMFRMMGQLGMPYTWAGAIEIVPYGFGKYGENYSFGCELGYSYYEDSYYYNCDFLSSGNYRFTDNYEEREDYYKIIPRMYFSKYGKGLFIGLGLLIIKEKYKQVKTDNISGKIDVFENKPTNYLLFEQIGYRFIWGPITLAFDLGLGRQFYEEASSDFGGNFNISLGLAF